MGRLLMRIFGRSHSTRGVVYANYYGDGDSESPQTVRHVYKDIEEKHFDCIGEIIKK